MQQALTLGGLVSARLNDTKTTKQELAESMGIKTVATLNAKLSGESDFLLSEAAVLSNFIGISLDEICLMLGISD